jgi:hypothetical protein
MPLAVLSRTAASICDVNGQEYGSSVLRVS